MKKTYSQLLRLSAGIFILLLLFYKIGFKEIYQVLKLANLWLLLPALFFFLLAWLVSTLNIYILLHPKKIKIGILRLFKYYSISKAVSLIFPGHLGEFSIIFLLKKQGLNLGEGGALITLDKLITIAVSTLFALIGLYLFFDFSTALKIMLFLLAIFLLSCILLTKKIRGWIKRFILRKHAAKFAGFSTTFFSYLKHEKEILFLDVSLTIIRIFCNIIASYFVFLALGQVISFWILLIVGCMETIVTLIPITINGLGTRQLTGVYILSTLGGVNSSIVAAKYVIYLIFNYGLGLLTMAFIKKLK